MLSYYYIKQLAAKAGTTKEYIAASVPNSAAYSNTSTSIGGQASIKYINLMCNIYLSKYSIAKYIILYIIV